MRRALVPFVLAAVPFVACATASPPRAPESPKSPSSAAAPAPLPAPLDLAPSERRARASLFGTDVVGLPTGATITPDAAPGSLLVELDPELPTAPKLRAGNAVATAMSPDGSTLLVLTSGYNRSFDSEGKRRPEASEEYVFVYDVSAGVKRTQVLHVANTFGGIAFHPSGDRFFVSGGPDDVVREYARGDGTSAATPQRGPHQKPAAWEERAPAIALGHRKPSGLGGLGIDQGPYAAGLALDAAGAVLVVANHENDSITVVDTATRAVRAEVSLAPGGGAAGGGFPSNVVVVDGRAYVSCQRDREVLEVDLGAKKVLGRVRVGGQPTKLVAKKDGTTIYVANANSDTVSAIDRARLAVLFEIPTGGPLRGSNPNALALSPDEQTLYVTNGGDSTLAVVALSPLPRVMGLVPTGFYPTAVSLAKNGATFYVVNGKSPTGPNAEGPWSDVPRSMKKFDAPGRADQFAPQLVTAGLLAAPVPSGEVLAKLTRQSELNNRASAPAAVPALFAALRGKVKHVVYVIGENRTYDQILGDLPGGDGDPKLVHWGEAITPNQHALAKGFVLLDRFFDSGGVSGDGWQWTVGGHTTDVAEKAIPVEYAERGRHSYDWEGTNRNVNVGLATLERRLAYNPETPADADLLPGTADVGAVDGPEEGGTGYLWDAALAAGLTVRNYGAFADDQRYNAAHKAHVPPLERPFDTQTRVVFPTRVSLQNVTDPYFRGFDMKLPDYWRFREWEREFDGYVTTGSLPALEIVRLPHDHLGAFAQAIDGVNTPDTQMADHDYALGLLVEKIAKSPFWNDTVVVIVEDDAQNGADHVDAHRSTAYFAGGHVKRGKVVRTPYTTPSVLRTIELLLGLAPLSQKDATARPMEELFDAAEAPSTFAAVVPAVLRSTKLPLPSAPGAPVALPRQDAAYWELAMSGIDFQHEDSLPSERFNRALFCGLVSATGCASEAALPVTQR